MREAPPRITVSDILKHLAGGMRKTEILEGFPDLQAEDISAVLTFAAERERRRDVLEFSR